MATYKCTMLFSQTSNQDNISSSKRTGGWSESVYAQGTDFALVQNYFIGLCNFRAALLNRSAAVIGQRYQLIDPTGRSFSTDFVRPGPSATTNKSDVPQMAITFVLPAIGTPNSRRFTLRGVPDAWAVEGEFFPVPGFDAAMAAFRTQLGRFRMRASNLQVAPTPINSVSAAGVFVLQQPLTFAANDYLNVTGAVKVNGEKISGRFQVATRVDAQNGTFGNWPNSATEGGKAKLDQIIYPLIDGTQTVSPEIVLRKVGRPRSGYRGRASARA